MTASRGRLGRRGGTSGSTGSVAATLILSDSSILANATVGDAATQLQPFTISKSSAGVWGVPSVSVSYGSGSSWLTLDTSRGDDGSVIVTPTITPGANTAGTKTATITVTDSLASNSPQTVSVSLTLANQAPIISLSPDSLIEVVQDEATGSAQTVTITNTGGTTASTPTIGTITGSGAAYLTASAVSGSGPWTFTVTPNATGGTPGSYTASVPVQLSGATTVNLLVALTVTPSTSVQQALLAISPRPLSDAAFTTGGATPSTEVLTLFSSNGVPLAGPSIVSQTFSGVNTGWATAAIAGSQLTVTYDVSGSKAASDGMSLLTTVIQDAAASNTITHETYLKVNAAATTNILSLSATSLSIPVTTGSNATTQTITVSNAGTGGFSGLGTVVESITTAVTWVSASYTPGTSTGTVTLTFNTSALSAGTYNATLQVAASGATNSPKTVPIQVVVGAAPAVRLLKYTLPIGMSQDPTTGAISGVPSGITTSRPSQWNGAATYTVTASGATGFAQLQSFINTAASVNNPVIEIPAGTTLTGTNLTMPPRTGTGYCVIRTSGYGSLPSAGTRYLPSRDDAYTATLSTTNASPVVRTLPSANRYFWHGITFTGSATSTTTVSNYGHVVLIPMTFQSPPGDYVNVFTSDQSNNPSDLYFSQCRFKGVTGARKGMYVAAVNRLSVTDCYFDNYRVNGFEGQAINILYGGSSFYIANNYLEGCGENFMMGGAQIPYETDSWNPRDLYFKNNHCRGKWEWFSWHPTYDGLGGSFKNLFEIKRGHRILVHGCVFNRGGISGQAGIQIVFKSDNNNGNNLSTPTVSATSNVQMLHCVGYDMQRVLGVGGNSSPKGGITIPNDRHHITDNVFYTLNTSPNTGPGYLTEVGNGSSNVDITHNTFASNQGTISYGIMTFLGGTTYNLTYTDNIIPKGTYGVASGIGSFAKAAMDAKASVYQWVRNVHAGSWTTAERNAMPTGNYYPASESSIGFTAYPATSASSLALAAGSAYNDLDTSTSPASDAGADVTAVAAAVSGVESP